MTKKEFQDFSHTLLQWFEENGRHGLPWRKKNVTAYEVWISEIMLQQTQVSRVTEYYQKFLQRFENVTKLAEASWEEFLPYYQGLGYYARGRNMLEAAKIIVDERNAQFPKEEKDLRSLPGVGPYTAKAILAFAYDRSVVAPDTNIKRIVKRYFPEMKESDAFSQMEQYLFDLGISGKNFNSALMDFGSLVCVARPTQEEHVCPFGGRCRCFFGVDTRKQFSKNKQVFPYAQAHAYVFLHENHQKYFSETKTKFTPFCLSRGFTSRESVQDYFQKKHGLQVSVRPPFRKMPEKKPPALFVYAQILSGEHDFFVYEKKEVEQYQSKF